MRIKYTGFIDVPDGLDDRGSVDIVIANQIQIYTDRYSDGDFDEPGEFFEAIGLSWEVET